MRPKASHYEKYGARHRRARAIVAYRVEAGLAICSRCGEPIEPGSLWDLDHLDGGARGEYLGPSHASCNRRTSIAGPSARPRRTSRDW